MDLRLQKGLNYWTWLLGFVLTNFSSCLVTAVKQRIRYLFRILTNTNDDKHDSILALIVSMKASSAIADFFEDVEEFCNIPAFERVAARLRRMLVADK